MLSLVDWKAVVTPPDGMNESLAGRVACRLEHCTSLAAVCVRPVEVAFSVLANVVKYSLLLWAED